MGETRKATSSPERFDELLTAATEHLRQDQVEEARTELAAAMELRADDPRVLGLYGLACFRLANFAEALPVYKKLVAQRPADAAFRLNLGLVHLKLGDPDRAIEQLSKSRELDPSQPRTVSYLGLAYARRGDYALGFEAFLRAGQDQLAREMEQYLGADKVEEIRSRVLGEAAPELGLASDAYESVSRAVAGDEGPGGEELEDSDPGRAPAPVIEESIDAGGEGGEGEEIQELDEVEEVHELDQVRELVEVDEFDEVSDDAIEEVADVTSPPPAPAAAEPVLDLRRSLCSRLRRSLRSRLRGSLRSRSGRRPSPKPRGSLRSRPGRRRDRSLRPRLRLPLRLRRGPPLRLRPGPRVQPAMGWSRRSTGARASSPRRWPWPRRRPRRQPPAPGWAPASTRPSRSPSWPPRGSSGPTTAITRSRPAPAAS